MHLSLLSDAYLSDSLADLGPMPLESLGRVHRDGLLRGLLVALALALPLGLTMVLAPAETAGSAAPAATQLRVTHLHMS